MTKLGLFLSRKMGISKNRLNELTNDTSMKLRVDKLYMITLAIDVDPCKLLKDVCK